MSQSASRPRAALAIVLMCCAASACLSPARSQATLASPANVSRVDSILRPIVEQFKTPGLSAVVMEGDAVIGRGVAGVRVAAPARPDPIRDGDWFHIGSVTKPMTMTMIATLVDQGVLSWDLTLARAFPEFAAEMRPEYRDVTLRDLITHRSGMPAVVSGAEAAALPVTTGGSESEARLALVRALLWSPPAKPRGEYLYSNVGIMTAAAIAEHATGKSYAALMSERVFGPLRMTTAGAGWPVVRDSAQPWGHRGRGGVLTPTGPTDPYRLQPAINPAGNFSMSVEDLARFGAAQLHMFRGEPSLTRAATLRWRFFPPSGQPLPETSVDLLRPDGAPATFGDPADSVWSDDGSAGTFYARIVVDPSANLVIAIATNSMAEAAVTEAQSRLFRWAKRRQGVTWTPRDAPPSSGHGSTTPAATRLRELFDVIAANSGPRARAFVDAMAPAMRAGDGAQKMMALLERLTDAHGSFEIEKVESSMPNAIVVVARGFRGGNERITLRTEAASPFRITGLDVTQQP